MSLESGVGLGMEHRMIQKSHAEGGRGELKPPHLLFCFLLNRKGVHTRLIQNTLENKIFKKQECFGDKNILNMYIQDIFKKFMGVYNTCLSSYLLACEGYSKDEKNKISSAAFTLGNHF